MKPLLRWWIGLTSLAAFGTGWILLGNSNGANTAQPASQPSVALTPIPTLAPLPTLQSSPSMRPLQVRPSSLASPRLRTGGS